jgi:hypothetical protein
VRMVIEYQREWEPLIDEAGLRALAEPAFEFHLVKRPRMEARVRLPEGQAASSMSAVDLLDIYWKAASKDMPAKKRKSLNQLAQSIIEETGTEESA